MMNLVNSAEFLGFLEKNYSTDKAKELADLLKFYCSNKSSDGLFDFSSSEYNLILSQINEKLSFDKNEIIMLTDELSESLKRSKDIRSKMTNSSVEGYSTFLEEKNELEKKEAYYRLQIEIKKNYIEKVLIEVATLQSEYEKKKSNLELFLKGNSVNSISSNAAATYTILLDKLINRQRRILEKEFIRCFKSIINKDGFIDGIVIDSNINVHPYKNVEFDWKDLIEVASNNAFMSFLDNFNFDYKSLINDTLNNKNGSIKLPLEITSDFSQGEKQVYIMSLYLALLKTSKKDIPFFIDTPFARIDSEHRKKITNYFFKQIPNQMFILSTDEEIVGKYKKLLSDRINEKFLLQIDTYGETSILKGKYFGE